MRPGGWPCQIRILVEQFSAIPGSLFQRLENFHITRRVISGRYSSVWKLSHYAEGAPPPVCEGGSWVCSVPSLLRINSNQSRLRSPVVRPTTPRPILRTLHQLTDDRIRVHVV